MCTSKKDKQYNKNKPAKQYNKSKSSEELNATLMIVLGLGKLIIFGGSLCCVIVSGNKVKSDSEKRSAYKARIYENEEVVFEKRMKNADNEHAVVLWEKICDAEKREDLKALITEKKELKEIIEAEVDIVKSLDSILALGVWKKWPVIRKTFPQYDKNEVILAKHMKLDELIAVFDKKKIDGYNLPNQWMEDVITRFSLFGESNQFVFKEVRAAAPCTSAEEKELVVRKEKEFWERKIDEIFSAEECKTQSMVQEWKIVELSDKIIQTCFQKVDNALYWICDIFEKLFPKECKKLGHRGLNHFICDKKLSKEIKNDLQQELIKHKDEEKTFIAKLNKSMTEWDLCNEIREFRSAQIDAMTE